MALAKVVLPLFVPPAISTLWWATTAAPSAIRCTGVSTPAVTYSSSEYTTDGGLRIVHAGDAVTGGTNPCSRLPRKCRAGSSASMRGVAAPSVVFRLAAAALRNISSRAASIVCPESTRPRRRES